MLKLLYVPDVTMCLITAERRGAGAHVCSVQWARVTQSRDVRLSELYSFVHLTLDNNWAGMIDIKWRKDKSSQILTILKQ